MTERAASSALTRDDITQRLADFDSRRVEPGDRRAAAVVVAVGHLPDGTSAILLTLRPDRLRAHPGQFALPGGGVDSGETTEAAALRELYEEMGIRAEPTDVLGRLDDYITRSGYVISAYVVWVGDRLSEVRPSPDEVAEVFLPTMDEVGVAPRFVSIPESDLPVLQWPFRGRLIHAPTAAVIYQFAEVVLHRRHTRIDGIEQPVFAWR